MTSNDMTSDEIATQPEPEHIACAGDLLEAVIAGHPDIYTHLAVGAALAYLYDVYPPYPSRPQPTMPIDADTGVRQALQHLIEAAHQPGDIEEGLRIGLAVRELRTLAAVPDTAEPAPGDGGRP